MALKNEVWKTIADMEELPQDIRAELIDGVIYDMASPTTVHQRLVGFLYRKIGNYIESKNGTCEVFTAPYDVQLDKDDYTLVQPDIAVICDSDKITDKRCVGAPDWIMEVVSPSTDSRDYKVKLFKYRSAGVREYWIIDPIDKRVVVHRFEDEIVTSKIYPLDATVKSGIFPDLEIDFSTVRF